MNEKVTVIIVEDNEAIKELVDELVKFKTDIPIVHYSKERFAAQSILDENILPIADAILSKHTILADATAAMYALGFPKNLQGFRYMLDSIVECVFDPSLLHGISKNLYSIIAKKYDTTPERIERNLRNSIAITWERGDKARLQKLFSYSTESNKKPTNIEFIAVISDRIRLKHSLN